MSQNLVNTSSSSSQSSSNSNSKSPKNVKLKYATKENNGVKNNVVGEVTLKYKSDGVPLANNQTAYTNIQGGGGGGHDSGHDDEYTPPGLMPTNMVNRLGHIQTGERDDDDDVNVDNAHIYLSRNGSARTGQVDNIHHHEVISPNKTNHRKYIQHQHSL